MVVVIGTPVGGYPGLQAGEELIRYRDGQVTLAKMTEPLAIVWSRPLPEGSRPATVTVSRDAAGRWHCSILIETTVAHLPPSTAEVGIDAGITSLLTLDHPVPGRTDDQGKIDDPRYERRDRARLARAQCALAVQDASWSALRSMLEYKAADHGRTVIVVDRWLPSSKTCSGCGRVKTAMPLRERTFHCPAGGLVLDRDINAARSILAVGRAVAACGAGVRPTRR